MLLSRPQSNLPFLLVAGCAAWALAGLSPSSRASERTSTLSSTPRTWTVWFTEPVLIDVRSRGVEWRGHTYHLLRAGKATFALKDNRLTATLTAGAVTFDDVEYEVHMAVMDAEGRLLGTARDRVKVERTWLGKPLTTGHSLKFDFGVSEAFSRARSFTVAISERKVLTPDQWQEKE